jgi:hypothetical protein
VKETITAYVLLFVICLAMVGAYFVGEELRQCRIERAATEAFGTGRD